jgi:hypothetical protein
MLAKGANYELRSPNRSGRKSVRVAGTAAHAALTSYHSPGRVGQGVRATSEPGHAAASGPSGGTADSVTISSVRCVPVRVTARRGPVKDEDDLRNGQCKQREGQGRSEYA